MAQEQRNNILVLNSKFKFYRAGGTRVPELTFAILIWDLNTLLIPTIINKSRQMLSFLQGMTVPFFFRSTAVLCLN